MKKTIAFTIAEILVVLGLIVLTALLVIPNIVEDNKKLDSISKWKNSYQNIEYVFSAIAAQMSETDLATYKKAKNAEERESFFIELLNPYLRMTDKVDAKDYKVSFLNGLTVKTDDFYYINKHHKTSTGKVIGVKWLDTPEASADKIPMAIISVDLNGTNKPNRWGYDIFGVNVFKNKIEPVGKSDDEFLMKSDCSKKGKGIACSYYYYIYGGRLN